MRVYRVISIADSERERTLAYAQTREAARIKARVLFENENDQYHGPASNLRIELVDVPTDQASLVLLLEGDHSKMNVVTTWTISQRGGLHEVNNGE